jgi:hypothetical protein
VQALRQAFSLAGFGIRQRQSQVAKLIRPRLRLCGALGDALFERFVQGLEIFDAIGQFFSGYFDAEFSDHSIA